MQRARDANMQLVSLGCVVHALRGPPGAAQPIPWPASGATMQLRLHAGGGEAASGAESLLRARDGGEREED